MRRRSASSYLSTGQPRSFMMPEPFSSSSAMLSSRPSMRDSGKFSRVICSRPGPLSFTAFIAASSSAMWAAVRSRIQRVEFLISSPVQTTGPVRGLGAMSDLLVERFAHADLGRVIEAGMGLARNLPIPEGMKKLLVGRERNSDSEPNAGQVARSGLVFDRADEAGGEALAACGRQYRQAAEVEIALERPDHDAAHDRAVLLGNDGGRTGREYLRDAARGLAERARLGHELAAKLLEGGRDRRGHGGGIDGGRGAQDKGVAHAIFLA